MLYNFQRKKLCRHLLVGGALCAASLGIFSCTDTYDLGTKQPEGLNSIYNYMQEQGKFTNYLRLIDDLGQAEILSKTGSKTMFIADDAAFDKFYASNSWGVKKYEQLSLAQKKLLLYSAMIDNPYSTSMLSSAASTGDNGKPVKGEVCRRSSSLALYDSVTVIPSSDPNGILPNNDRFNEIKVSRDSIVLFTDASNAAPMLHFTGKFVTSNKMDLSDIDFIYNQPSGTFKSDDVYVNNSKVVNSNIFCKNGFIHEVDNVIMPLDNMAEIIRKNQQTRIFSSIIERFAAPDDSTRLKEAYNSNTGKNVDSVFVKRYFSDRSAGSTDVSSVPFQFDKNGSPFDAALKYDPGWNGYVPYIKNTRTPMMEDMGVMLVPSDKAIQNWWTNGGGKVIADYYQTIENTPNSVLAKLVNVNQLEAFGESVPSKFNEVLDDANEPMGITTADIDSVHLGCNGLVYITNKVFAPTSYSSVLFPAVIDTTNFRIISNAIDNMNYDKYLNSMVSEYTFLIPTNNGLLSYVDPVSYGTAKPKLWEFYLDLSKAKTKQICAKVYDCKLNEDGSWEKDLDGDNPITVTGGTDNAIIKDRMEDLLDNIIVTRGYDPNKKYYMTKGRSFVKIDEESDGIYVSGSFQAERQRPLKAVKTYQMENGNAFVLDGVVMGTRNSVARVLSENPDFSEFLDIMMACGALSTSDSKDGWQGGDQEFGNLFNLKDAGSVGAEDTKSGKKATYLLNNFHYTVYAPVNEAMLQAYEAGLPTLDDLEAAELLDDSLDIGATNPASAAAKIKEAMLDFVKYHIQDNSIYVDEGFTSGEYESGKTELIKSTAIKEDVTEAALAEIENITSYEKDEKGTYTVSYWNGKYSPGRPYKINVTVSGSDMYVQDCRNGYDPVSHQALGGETAKVITKEGYYNLMAREYWFSSSAKISSAHTVQINNSSAVVVQGIDKPLLYADGLHYDQKGLLAPSQFTYTYKPLTSESKRR